MGITRYDGVGLMGRKGTDFNPIDIVNSGATKAIPLVASGAAQILDLDLPGCQVTNCYLYVRVPESTGTTPTVSIGFSGGSGTELLGATTVSSAGVVGSYSGNVAVNILEEVTYTLGSADFAELEAYLVLQIAAVANP